MSNNNRIKSYFESSKPEPEQQPEFLAAQTPFADPFEWLFGRDSAFSKISRSAIEVTEYDDRYEVSVDAPGFAKEDLNVVVQGGTLIISGKIENEEKKSRSEFTRRVGLGEMCDTENVTASAKDGVLTVTIPKKPGSESRQIEIE